MKIAVMPGDGVGKEVIPEGLKILSAVSKKFGFSYTTTAGKLAPMLVTEDSSVFAFFGEVCFNGDPFTTLVRETRQNQTRTLSATNGHTVPYIAIP